MQPLPYPTDPVEIVLPDGIVRRVRFTAGAVRRARKEIQKRGLVDALEALPYLLWEGLLDRDGIVDADALAQAIDEIDFRGVPYLQKKVEEALKESEPLPRPISPAAAN
jgi:hypothetical protein